MRKYNLAVMLDRGQGVPTNGAEAPKWYMKAADHQPRTISGSSLKTARPCHRIMMRR
jgi:TPR repeat protein